MINQQTKTNPHPENQPHLHYRLIIIVTAFFVLFAAYGGRAAYGVFFKPMAAELGYNSAMISAAYSISMILEGVFSFVLGGMTDRFGPRKILTFSCILVGIGYCLMPLVHHLWQLYLFYGVIIGIGMGGMYIPIISMIARWFTTRRNLITGIVSCGAGIGMVVMPPLAVNLIERVSWRETFVIMGIIIFLVILVAAQFVKRDPTVMGLSPYGQSNLPKTGPTAPAEGFSFKEALRTRLFWTILIIFFLFSFFSTSISVHIVPDAINSGMVPTIAAYILATSGGLMNLGRIFLGVAADRLGNKRIMVFGIIVSTMGLLWIAITQAHWVFFVCAAIMGFSQGGIQISQSPMVANLFGLKSLGLILGCIGFGSTLGSSLGPYLTGYIFDVTGSYRVALLLCVATNILALVFTFLIRPVRTPDVVTNTSPPVSFEG